jgi:hypothetical protein
MTGAVYIHIASASSFPKFVVEKCGLVLFQRSYSVVFQLLEVLKAVSAPEGQAPKASFANQTLFENPTFGNDPAPQVKPFCCVIGHLVVHVERGHGSRARSCRIS